MRLWRTAFFQQGASRIRSVSLVSREFHEVFRVGFLLAGISDADQLAEVRPRSFLLGPGGRDYVGDNSYDDKSSSESPEDPADTWFARVPLDASSGSLGVAPAAAVKERERADS
jgi:hypothetical protein